MAGHWRHIPPGQRPGPPDARDVPPCPYPMAKVTEAPQHDWARIGNLLDELIEDDNIRPSTEEFLLSLHAQLERQGWLSDRQVVRIYEVEARRDREGKRGF